MKTEAEIAIKFMNSIVWFYKEIPTRSCKVIVKYKVGHKISGYGFAEYSQHLKGFYTYEGNELKFKTDFKKWAVIPSSN